MNIFVHCPTHPGRPNREHWMCQVAASVNAQQLTRMVPGPIPLTTPELLAADGRWQ